MYVIGITGPIGHGKTTFANLLNSVEPRCEQIESSTLIAEVANAWLSQTPAVPKKDDIAAINQWVQLLVPIVEQHLQARCRPDQLLITQEHLMTQPEHFVKLLQFIDMVQQNPELTKTPITPENKETFRPILQWLGGFLPGRLDSSLWYREIVRRIHASTSETVLYVVGGLRYPADANMITGAGGTVVKIYRPQVDETDLTDPTERQRHIINASVEVINDGSLDELLAVAQTLYRDLVNESLQTQYKATQTAVN